MKPTQSQNLTTLRPQQQGQAARPNEKQLRVK